MSAIASNESILFSLQTAIRQAEDKIKVFLKVIEVNQTNISENRVSGNFFSPTFLNADQNILNSQQNIILQQANITEFQTQLSQIKENILSLIPSDPIINLPGEDNIIIQQDIQAPTSNLLIIGIIAVGLFLFAK